jgi:hypothetical protein
MSAALDHKKKAAVKGFNEKRELAKRAGHWTRWITIQTFSTCLKNTKEENNEIGHFLRVALPFRGDNGRIVDGGREHRFGVRL